MGRFEGASAIEVFRWVTRHMIEDLGQRILQVVAGKGITGAQIEQAMSSQTIEELCWSTIRIVRVQAITKGDTSIRNTTTRGRWFREQRTCRNNKREESQEIWGDRVLLFMEGRCME